MAKSKSKKTKLTRELLLKSPEFWIENIRTELFNMVQNYMDENDLSRKELADELGFSKGYISQILNGDSDHRISKMVSLATALGKAPYIYLKDVDLVLDADQNDKGIYIDFEELESKAERCDLMDSLNSAKSITKENYVNHNWMKYLINTSAVHDTNASSIEDVASQEFDELNKELQSHFIYEA